MKNLLLRITSSLLLLCAASTQAATTKYWDINGATAGSGQGTATGTWNTTGTTWSTDPAGGIATVAFATGDAAVFSAGTDGTGAWTINLGSALTAGSVTVEEGTVTKTGSALTTQTIVVNSPAAFFTSAALALTVSSPGGTCTLNGGTIGNSNPGSSGSFLGSSTANANMGIVLGTGGGHVSANGGAGIITIYTGLISGTGPLTVDGSGIFRLTTTVATYSGATILNGRLQLSTTGNVLPAATDMTINSGGVFDDQAAQTIGSLSGSGSITFLNGITLTLGNSLNTTFSGPVSGSGTVTKVGTGTLTISGNDWANTGNININAGAIKYGDAAAGLSSSSTVTIAAAGTLDLNGFNDTFGQLAGAGNVVNNSGSTGLKVGGNNASGTFSGVLSGTGNLEKLGTGTLTLSGVNTYSGKTTISAGLLTINNQATTTDSPLGTAPASPVADQLIFNGGALSLGSANNITFDANRGITLQAGGGQLQGSSKDLTVPGNIVGAGGFIKTNSANLTLSGQNTFAGDFKIYGGGVRFNGDDTAGHGNVIVGPTTAIVTLRNLPPTTVSTLTNNITLNSGGTSDIDVTCQSGSTFTLSGNISGTGYLTRGRASGASGNVVLSGNNSGWSGGLFWGRGPLTLGHKNALGTGTLTMTNLALGESNVLMSATALTGANAVGNAVSLTGLMIVAGNNDLELSGPMTLAFGANNTITNRSTGAFVISGQISGGLAGITISGPGTTVFNGPQVNAYSGPTIVNGSLDVQKTQGLGGGGNVTVNNGATLKIGGALNNQYIGSTANLLLNGAAPVVNLAFTGTPNGINALSFDGGTTFKAAGTWGAIGSGAQHEDARFTGSGMLSVATGPFTTTALATSSPAAAYGAPVTLTATVSASQGTAAGTVEFYDGATLIGSAATVGGVAALNAAGLLNVAGSPHSLTATFLANNDFAGSTSSAISQTISAATVTASITVSGKTYDGTTAGTIVNRSLSGVFGADDVTLGATGTAVFGDKNVGAGKSVTVSGLAISGATAPNYVLASDTVNTSANISAVVLTVTGLSAASKAYDGSTVASVTGTPTLSAGVVGSEDVTLTGTAVGNFATRSPGTGKAVTVAGLAIGGADIGNYSLTAPVLTADITAPPPLTVTGITCDNKPFDGTTNATLVLTNAALVGVVGSDTVTLVTSNAVGGFETPDVGDGKTVTVTGLAIAGADATNYSLTQPTTTADIKLALNVTNIVASNKVYDGGTAASVSFAGAGLDGVQGTDDVTLDTTGASAAFADKNVGTGKTVTVAGLALTGADASKYLLVTITASADITAAPLTVSGLAAQNRTYDGGTAVSVTGTPALSGLFGSDSVMLVGTAAGSFADKNAGLAKAVTVTSLSITGIDAGNYLFTLPALSADIAQAGLTVTGLTAQSRVYNGGTVAGVTGTPVLSGVIGTDDVSLTGTAAGTFADKAVGISKAVTVSGLSTTGADAANYALTLPTLNADITPAGLTVTGLSATSKVYDRTTAANVTGTPALAGVFGTDDVSLSGTAAGSFADAAVGTSKPVTVTGLSISGADAGNYALTLPTLNANITPAPLTVSGLAAQNRAYDGGTAASVTGTPALSGVIAPDDVSLTGTASGNFADKAVGNSKPVTVSGLSISGTDAGNYALTQPTLSANITAAGLTVTGLSAQSRVYDGGTVATVTGTPALVGVIGTDDVSLTGTAAGSFADKAVGNSRPVTVSALSTTGADAGNYTLTLPTLNADITAAPLTVSGITADNKAYDGTTNATLVLTNAALVGVIGSDSVTLVTSNAVGAFETPEAGTARTVSVSGLEIAGADSTNYSLVQPATTADITPAGLTVIGLSAQSKIYDAGTVASLTGTPMLSGVVGTDDVSLTGTASGSFANKAVGLAKPVTVSGLSLTGADATNYTLTLPTLSADITPAGLTVTGLSAQNKVYDGTTAATLSGTPALSGVIGTDDVSLSGTASGVFTDKNVGTAKAVTVSGLSTTGADAGNYALTLPTLNADITALATTNGLISSLNPSIVGSNVTFTATLAGNPPATDGPTGGVVFLANGVPFATNELVSGSASANTTSLPLGTNTVSSEYAGDGNFLGSTGTLQQVVETGVTCSGVNMLTGIANNHDGTLTLSFIGTPQAQYYVLSSANVTAPISSWTILAGSTNTVTNVSGAWTFTVTNTAPVQFYRSGAVAPCP